MAWTVQKLIDGDMAIHAYCQHSRCGHHRLVDLDKIRAKLGPDPRVAQDDGQEVVLALFLSWRYVPLMGDDIELRLKWRHTWDDREDDFSAIAPSYSGCVGRIYLNSGGPTDGLWFWSLTASGSDISRNVGKLSGYESSARLAARAVEDAWFSAIKGSTHDSPPRPTNAYAAAKDPD
jgi:hypothetical protein